MCSKFFVHLDCRYRCHTPVASPAFQLEGSIPAAAGIGHTAGLPGVCTVRRSLKACTCSEWVEEVCYPSLVGAVGSHLEEVVGTHRSAAAVVAAAAVGSAALVVETRYRVAVRR